VVCTFLLPMLRHLQPQFHYIDPAEQTVHSLIDLLDRHSLLAPAPQDPTPVSHLLTTTGNSDAFTAQLCRFLLADAACIRQAQWRDGALHLPTT
jgi:hypothetical protein